MKLEPALLSGPVGDFVNRRPISFKKKQNSFIGFLRSRASTVNSLLLGTGNEVTVSYVRRLFFEIQVEEKKMKCF